MKTKFLILLSLIFFQLTLLAQNHPRISKDNILANKWEFIVQKARLNPAEVSKVKPLFIEFETSVWDLFEKNKDIFKGFRQKKQGESINYEVINEALINFEIEKAQIQKKYYLKLKKVVSSETINKLLNAERFFRKDLIQGIPPVKGKHGSYQDN